MQYKIQHSCDRCGSPLDGAVEHGACEHCGAYYSIVKAPEKNNNSVVDKALLKRLEQLAGITRSTAGAGIKN